MRIVENKGIEAQIDYKGNINKVKLLYFQEHYLCKKQNNLQDEKIMEQASLQVLTRNSVNCRPLYTHPIGVSKHRMKSINMLYRLGSRQFRET